MRSDTKAQLLAAFATLLLAAYVIQEGRWLLAAVNAMVMCLWLACAQQLVAKATGRVLSRLDGG